MRKIIGAREELYGKIAAEFAEAVQKKPNAAFAFTTVDVPAGALEAIAASGADFSGAQAFNACEYVGEAAEGEHSQAIKLNALLYEKTPFAAVHVPAEEGYDADIRAAGGLDLVLLGIGERGHIAFCEPGAEFGSETFTMKLADITRKQAAEEFGSLDETPTHSMRRRRTALRWAFLHSSPQSAFCSLPAERKRPTPCRKPLREGRRLLSPRLSCSCTQM